VDRYDQSGTLAQNLDNMTTIIRHFTSKIDQWEAANSQNFITAPAQVRPAALCAAVHACVHSCRLLSSSLLTCVHHQVMELIRTNYETLKLTLQDDLDAYDPYLENPREVSSSPFSSRSLSRVCLLSARTHTHAHVAHDTLSLVACNQVPFFRQLIRTIVADYRSVVDLSFTPPPPEEIISAITASGSSTTTPTRDKGKERQK
jgi:hypothetical protein